MGTLQTLHFRCVTAIALLTASGLMAIALEKQSLTLKREISAQHVELSALEEQRARLRLEVAQRRAALLQAAALAQLRERRD